MLKPMRFKKNIWCTYATLFLFNYCVHGLTVTGTLNTGSSFSLVGRFTYSQVSQDAPSPNVLIAKIEAPAKYENLVGAFYFSDWEGWTSLNTQFSCVNKIDAASALMCATNRSNCPTTPYARYPKDADDPEYFLKDNIEMISVNIKFDFTANNEVEYFWAALANCNVRACKGKYLCYYRKYQLERIINS